MRIWWQAANTSRKRQLDRFILLDVNSNQLKQEERPAVRARHSSCRAVLLLPSPYQVSIHVLSVAIHCEIASWVLYWVMTGHP